MSEKISGRKAHFIREKFETKTAILVDGGFYRSRANALVGSKSPKERADELERYCLDHLHDKYEKRFYIVSSIMTVLPLKREQMCIILSLSGR